MSLMCVGTILLGTLSPSLVGSTAYAFGSKDGDISANMYSVKGTPNDPMSWNQSLMADEFAKSKYGEATVGSAYSAQSCMTNSAAFVALKSGYRERGSFWTPDWREELLDAGLLVMGGWCDYNSYGTFGTNVTPVEWQPTTNMEDIKKNHEAGYIQLLLVNSPQGYVGYHLIAVDDVTESGDIMIMDSGFTGLKLQDYYTNDLLVSIVKMKMKDGRKVQDLPTFWNDREGNGSGKSKSSEPSQPVTSLKDDLPSEEELKGMRGRNYLRDYQADLYHTVNTAEVALDYASAKNLASLKESVGSTKFNFLSFLRTCVSFVGVLFAVYSLVLLVCYVFDRVNTFIDFSLLKIVTGGRYEVDYDGSGDEQGSHGGSGITTKPVNLTGILRLFVLTNLVGWVLYSGVIYSILSMLYYWLGNITGWW